MKFYLLLILLVPSLLFADTMLLKSGAVVEGRLVKLGEYDVVWLKADSTTVEYARVFVKEIRDPSGALLMDRELAIKLDDGWYKSRPRLKLFRDHTTTYTFASGGMGRYVDNGSSYGFFGGDVRHARLFYRHIQSARYEFEALNPSLMFGVEYQELQIPSASDYSHFRLLVALGPAMKGEINADYAYHRLGLLLVGQGDDGYIVPVWSVAGGKRINDDWLVRGSWYVNPLAYLGNLVYNFRLLSQVDALEIDPASEQREYVDPPPFETSVAYRYINGFQITVSRAIAGGVFVEGGIAADENLELMLRLTWTNYRTQLPHP